MPINYLITYEGTYTAKVVNPNGVADPRPNGDEEVVNVVYAFDNADWQSDITVNVGGNSSTSWYLKSASAGVVASGFGGANTNVTIVPNECYELMIVQGDGESFSVTDVNGVCTQGTSVGPQYSAFFGSGNNPWTGVEEELNKLKLYPNPTSDFLKIEGAYDRVQIYDVFGRSVLNSNYQQNINVSDLPQGTYIVELKIKDQSIRKDLQIIK